MDPQFWHDRWQENRIGFHQDQPNRMLVAHIDRLALAEGSRVFLPLCGKTNDIAWLLARGHRVVGAELSAMAIDQLFADLGVEAESRDQGAFVRRTAPNLDILVGDIFEIDAAALGPVDAVFDRAALVALPPDMRPRYAAHLAAITGRAPQLLVTFEYDQSQMDGPPFSVPASEIESLYGDDYRIERVATEAVPGGLKGTVAADEVAWHLT